jgi:hypothetical protein
LLGVGIWKRFQMFTADRGDEWMGDPALPGDLAITPSRPSLAADERRDGFHLVRAAARQSVLRVRAAGKEKCVVAVAGVNLAFDIFDVGMRQ